jgi:hypothetical protein
MTMDRRSLESSILVDHAFRCPACGNLHTWDKKDAYLKDEW